MLSFGYNRGLTTLCGYPGRLAGGLGVPAHTPARVLPVPNSAPSVNPPCGATAVAAFAVAVAVTMAETEAETDLRLRLRLILGCG